jgi:hypothetical protein
MSFDFVVVREDTNHGIWTPTDRTNNKKYL